MSDIAYVRTQMAAAEPAPRSTSGAVAWMRKNLFATTTDTVLTVLAGLFLLWVIPPLFGWFLGNAVWPGGTVEELSLIHI